MRRIPLTQGQVAIVDDEDFLKITAHKWCARWSKGTRSFYAVRAAPGIGGSQVTVYMHREIMLAGPEDKVDHAHHDTLDNRKSELRLCNDAQNLYNSRRASSNSSGLKGVSWSAHAKRWRSTINYSRKQTHLGYFLSQREAADAYDAAAIRIFGEFALTNAEILIRSVAIGARESECQICNGNCPDRNELP